MKKTNRGKKIFLTTLSIIICCSLIGCYYFLNGSTEGFTIDGIYDGGTNTQIGLCNSATLNTWMFNYMGDSYDSLANSDCLRFSITGTCFPTTTSTGFARFDFVSPSPTNWSPSIGAKEFDGFSFYFKTNLPGIQVQGIAKLTLTDGTTTSYASTFYPVTQYDPWTNFSLSSLAGAVDIDTIDEVYVRVFVPNSTISLYSGPGAIVMFDAVEPIYS